MLIHIVTEVDERPESVSSGPISVHFDKGVADRRAERFNAPLRGKVDEIGHYANVFPLDLNIAELTSADLQTLRDEVIRQQSRLARGRRS